MLLTLKYLLKISTVISFVLLCENSFVETPFCLTEDRKTLSTNLKMKLFRSIRGHVPTSLRNA